MKFTKMHGCGNDYIYINGFVEKFNKKEKAEIAKKVSDRHFSIGGDGAIFINPSEQADFEMEMYNADGSYSQMCGNGIRCVGKFVYDKGMTDRTDIRVSSGGEVKYLELFLKDHLVEKVRVNMGKPEFMAERIPVVSSNEKVIQEEMEVEGNCYKITCVSMGNPHAVVFMEDVNSLQIENIGPHFEHHKRFPERTNTEFVKILNHNEIEMRVWERGSGETLACGTGCCAAVAACIVNGLTDNKVKVNVLGGTIEVEWDREKNVIYMTGPAVNVFEGEIEIELE